MKFIYLSLLSGFTLTSCGGAPTNLNEIQNKEPTIPESISQYGYLRTESGLLGVTYTVENGMAVLDDHVRLPLNSISTSLGEDGLGLASARGIKPWPAGRIPYVLPANFDYPNEWKVMVETWGRAGVQWVPRGTSDQNYVVVELTADSACGVSQMTGMLGGAQRLTLKPKAKIGTCDMQRTIIHEAGHVMGFLHEHTRSDRDSYITVDLSRVLFPATASQSLRAAKLEDLKKQTQKIDGSINTTPYDVKSIMHYGTEQTLGAIRTKSGGVIELARMPSELDIASAKQAYSNIIALAAAPTPVPAAANKCEVIGIRQNVLHASSLSKANCESKCSELEKTDANRRCAWNSQVFRAHPEKRCLAKNGSQTLTDLKSTTARVCEVLSLSHSRYYPKHTMIWGDQKIR